MSKTKPVTGAKSADCFADPRHGWIYRFPIDRSRERDLGRPAVLVEPLFQRGRIVGLYVTYVQVPNHGETYYIHVGKRGSDGLYFADWSTPVGPMVGWCSKHGLCSLYVYVPDTDYFTVDVLQAGITIWLKPKEGL